MSSIVYNGPFKEHIQNYVQLKKAMGYKCKSIEKRLKLFDKFTLEKYPNTTSFTKEIVLEWCNKNTYEVRSTQSLRIYSIRQFGKYLDSIGCKAYIIPRRYYPKSVQYTPYIYTVDELAKFFAATDKCQYSARSPYRHLIMPLIFRMIYMCGLRLSEARMLKVIDVNLEQGILTINHSKNNSRLVPMSDSLTERCRHFSEKMHPYPAEKDYYFSIRNDEPIKASALYENFRIFLWRAKISHGGRGTGPRIHDFRHAYAVHCLKKWTEEGKDLNVYLPVLKAYMGHYSFKDTAYYLRMTADVFPNIIFKMESQYFGIIPELREKSNETH